MLNKLLFILSISLILILTYLNHYYHLYYFDKKTYNYYIHSLKNKDLIRKGFFSDKLKAKEYIDKNFPYIKTPKTLFKTKNPEELQNYDLPDKFVLKNSSGSQMNIIVNNGKYNIKTLIKKSKKFLKTKYSTNSYRKFINAKERQYDYNDPTIYIEEFLENGIKDYKCAVIKGKLAFLSVNYKKHGEKKYYKNIYDADFNLENYRRLTHESFFKEIDIDDEKKEIFKKFIKDFYEKEKFDFVRIDFFIENNEVYFGEFTFTPDNCMCKYSKDFEKLIYNKYIKLNE